MLATQGDKLSGQKDARVGKGRDSEGVGKLAGCHFVLVDPLSFQSS